MIKLISSFFLFAEKMEKDQWVAEKKEKDQWKGLILWKRINVRV
jgi:hypothetical protein